MRHSSAPSQSNPQINIQTQNAERKSRAIKSNIALSSKDDADTTFEDFVNYESIYMNGWHGNSNEASQSKGTQTTEKQNQDENRETYFRSRESKRIDSAVKKAQRAYYETYLRELQYDTKTMIPHPPSQPSRPDIRKPVNTTRINR